MKLTAAPLLGRQYRAGQTIVEFGLSATLFLLLLFGVLQMLLAMYQYNTLCSAAREAVRYAIAHSPTSANPASSAQIQQVAINYAPALNLTASDISVSFVTDANLPSQNDAKVAISYQYQLQIPFITPVTMTLSTTSQMLASQ